MIKPDAYIVVFHLTSAQLVVADCTASGNNLYKLLHPHEMVAIPPSQSNPLPSFAMTPFGSFYGMLNPADSLWLDASKYIHATVLPLDDPIRQFYIDSVNSKKAPV